LGHGSGEREVDSAAAVACTMHQCAVFWVSYYAGNAEALDR